MRFILDADGLIKLNHAGVLERVAETYSCVIPEAVYDEVVTQGKARRYMDAEAIEVALTQRVQVTPV